MNAMSQSDKDKWFELARKHNLNLPMLGGEKGPGTGREGSKTIEWWHLEPGEVSGGKRGDLGLRGQKYIEHIKGRSLAGVASSAGQSVAAGQGAAMPPLQAANADHEAASASSTGVPATVAERQATQSVVRHLNQEATRNKAITPELEARVHEAVRAVYGDGARADLYSGGQDRKGEGTRRTGSTRHDDGKAGDFRFYDAEGKQITGDALGKIGQYWTAKGYGGVGMEMRGGGVHLDEHTDRAKSWGYEKDGGRYTKAQREAIQRGLAGELPELKMDPALAALPGAAPSVQTPQETRTTSEPAASGVATAPNPPGSSAPGAVPRAPALTAERRDEMRGQLAAMRGRAEAQLQRTDLDPEIRTQYERLLTEVGEKERQVEQVRVSNMDAPAPPDRAPVAAHSYPVTGTAGDAGTAGTSPTSKPLNPLTRSFASMMSLIPGTSESWRAAAADGATGGRPASGMMAGLLSAGGNAIQTTLGALAQGPQGLPRRSPPNPRDALKGAARAAVPNLAGMAGGILNQASAGGLGALAAIPQQAVGAMSGAVAPMMSALSVAPPIPSLPASMPIPSPAAAPSIQEPATSPRNQGAGERKDDNRPVHHVGQDVRDRRIAHIVTGGIGAAL